MSKKNANFTRKRIAESGFVEVSPGVFAKPESPTHCPLRNQEPQAPDMERDPPKKREGKTRPKERGKKSNPEGIRYQLLVISYRARAIDHSNCCAKYIEDFLVNQGFIPDDNPFTCEIPIVRQVIVPEKEQRTEVMLFQIK